MIFEPINFYNIVQNGHPLDSQPNLFSSLSRSSPVNFAPDVQRDPILRRNRTHPDSPALPSHRVTFALCRRSAKNRSGSPAAFASTVITAKLTLDHGECCDPLATTWCLKIESASFTLVTMTTAARKVLLLLEILLRVALIFSGKTVLLLVNFR